MKKIGFFILLSGIFLFGFSMAKDNAVVCTMEYAPVCAEVHVQCIKAPCLAIKETFGNKCTMNANKLAKFLYKGECKEDKKNIECPQYSAPAPGFCSGGKIIDGAKDENGCQGHPVCIEKIDLNNCETYFDGCNTCFVSDGKIGGCTKMYCEDPKEPKCLVEKKDNIDLEQCESYFDGCNNCSVVNGKINACTEMYCEKPTEPKCLKYKEAILNMVNPASKFCIENSGDLKILDGTGGQYGMCEFKDGSKCEERAFFRGECKPEYKKIQNIFNKYFEKYANKFQKLEDRKIFLEEFKLKIQSISEGAKLGLKKTYNKIVKAIESYW